MLSEEKFKEQVAKEINKEIEKEKKELNIEKTKGEKLKRKIQEYKVRIDLLRNYKNWLQEMIDTGGRRFLNFKWFDKKSALEEANFRIKNYELKIMDIEIELGRVVFLETIGDFLQGDYIRNYSLRKKRIKIS